MWIIKAVSITANRQNHSIPHWRDFGLCPAALSPIIWKMDSRRSLSAVAGGNDKFGLWCALAKKGGIAPNFTNKMKSKL